MSASTLTILPTLDLIFKVDPTRQHVVEIFRETNLPFSNFAQRHNAAFVVSNDKRLSVSIQLERALHGEVNERKAIGNLFQTVFNGNACHAILEVWGARS